MVKTVKVLIGAFVILFAIFLVACGTPAPPSPTTSTDLPAVTSEAALPTPEKEEEQHYGRINLKWWAFPTFDASMRYEKELVEAFKQVRPDVDIEITMIDFASGPDLLETAINTGTAPDILLDSPGRIIDYGRRGEILPLDDFFTDEFEADVNEDLLNACKADGVPYMYPLSSSPFYMGLNYEMLVESGALAYVNLEGDRTWTTENFIAMCNALKVHGITPGIVYCGGRGGDQGTRALVNNLYSNRFVSESGSWMIAEDGVRALELLQDMTENGSMTANARFEATEEITAFRDQEVAMTFCWGTSNAILHASDEYTQISVPFPSDDGIPSLEFLASGFCVFDNDNDAKAEAAKQFVSFVCDDAVYGPKSVIMSGAFPARESFGDLYPDDEEKRLLASWTKYYGEYYNNLPGFSEMREQWWTMLQNITNGEEVTRAVSTFITVANEG